jgi:predicted hotdog family 3-hydroxylacyl-ACP dehydratase
MSRSVGKSVQLDKNDIRALIPHQGAMCMLDEVLSWDATRIVCASHSHVSPDNPLRSEGRLRAVCGVEYAAQAMALHGALLSARPIAAGYLVSVRNLRLHVSYLDDLDDSLTVDAKRLMGGAEGLVYEFTVSARNDTLLSGRLTVSLFQGGKDE